MKLTIATLISVGLAGAAQASLWVDFNSTTQGGGPNNQTGYQAFSKPHEDATAIGTAEVYATNFALTGLTNVTLQAAYPNTTDNRVQQSIDRGAGFGANWNNVNGDLNLVTDFLGIDTRTGNGGQGDWDGTIGTPTYMTLTLNGLAAGDYTWTSFHADTEHVHGNFAVWIDTGGGLNQIADGTMTDATDGGNPDSATDGSNLQADLIGPLNTYSTSFTADGVNDVTLQFAPYSGEFGAVHNQIWGISGFQLEQVPEPSTGLLGLLGAAMLLRRRR